MKEKALENFKNGYSCSESVVKAAADNGLVNHSLIPVATPFSGGISSGCLCGAVAGMQLVIGAMKGRISTEQSRLDAKTLAKISMEKFKEKNKFTCCKALTAGLEMGSPERKQNCCKLVCDCAEILEELVSNKIES